MNLRLPWRRAREGRDLLRPHELAVIEAVRATLAPEAARLLDMQVSAVRYVSRYIENAYVDLYPRRRGPQVYDDSIAFPNRSLDLSLATVRIQGPNANGKAVVSGVNGHVFEIYFSPSPKRLGAADQIQATRVTLHVDPMEPASGTAGNAQLIRLDLPIRAELDSIWENRPSWASAVVEPHEVYSVHVDDTEYLVLAQLPDTTYLAAPLDAPGAGVSRFETDGDPIGRYATVSEAIASRDKLLSRQAPKDEV